MDRLDWNIQASLLPRRFGVDAIVPYYDFTAMTASLGMTFVQHRDFGPTLAKPIRTRDDIACFSDVPNIEKCRPVADLLRGLRQVLNDGLPILAVVDSPFIIATYCLGLSKNLELVRIFIREHADVWTALVERITVAVSIFVVKVLKAADVDVIQISDSLAGQLTEDEYNRWVLRAHKRLIADASPIGTVLFVKDGSNIEAMSACGADAVGLSSHHDLAADRRRWPQLTLQGNIRAELLRTGTPDEVIHVAQACLNHGGGQRHILNVDCGLASDSKLENVAALIATARSFRVA